MEVNHLVNCQINGLHRILDKKIYTYVRETLFYLETPNELREYIQEISLLKNLYKLGDN